MTIVLLDTVMDIASEQLCTTNMAVSLDPSNYCYAFSEHYFLD